jgi:signal transduction histidine kinase
MRFSLKIFISIFGATLILGTTFVWVGYRHVSDQTREEFISRYEVFSKVMGDTLTRLDKNTEDLMLNAAKVVAARDAVHGLLSTETLKAMRSELNMTHIFMTDNQGKFIRSTNEDPKLIPNAFSFCPAYQNMALGKSNLEATPIVVPRPEPKPYKFLFLPTADRKRLIEVGVRVDFSAKTLSEALGSDENIISMSLYDPVGGSLGRFTSKEVDFNVAKKELPSQFPKVIEANDAFHFFTKVMSSHPKCCQCEVSGTSKAGEYYYVLESEVSKKELTAMMARTRDLFVALAVGNLILAFLIGRFLALRLVRNIEVAVAKVRSVKRSGDLKSRLHIEGKDEVAFLTKEFDRLLDSLEESQKKVVESEKLESKVQLAKEVAHNIRSPVVALEMMLPRLMNLPEKTQKIFKDTAREIKALSERLSKQADSLTQKPGAEVLISNLIQDEVRQKQIEFSGNKNIQFSVQIAAESKNSTLTVDPTDLRAIISNLINNAAESYPDQKGLISVELRSERNNPVITIEDNGMGIPTEILEQLGSVEITYGKVGGKGIGLVHASRTIKSWGGSLKIISTIGRGTQISIYFSDPGLPLFAESKDLQL